MFGSCVTFRFASPRFCQTLAVDIPWRCRETPGAQVARVSSARKLALAMQMATISHHSLHRAGRADASTQTVTCAAPVDDCITPDPAVFTASAPPLAATRAATSAPSPAWHKHLMSPVLHLRVWRL